MKKRVIAWMVIVSLLLSGLPAPAFAATTSEIETQIEETYEEALDRSGKSSFDGYCGDYVNWHLVVLGINKTNVAGHGKDQYDNYKNLSKSTGGYPITAYSAKNYTLRSVLNHITNYGTTDVYNILVGFQRTDSSPKYGHAFFIHAIIDGIVYYSESYDCKIDGTRYREGHVIACTIDQMATYYGYWATFEGIIHFGTIYPSEMTLTDLEMPDIVAQGTAPALTGNLEYHRTIERLEICVDSGDTLETVTQVQCEPKSYTYDLTALLSRLDFAGLQTGEYTLNVYATGDGREQQLYSKDFTVYPSQITVTGVKMPGVIVEGTAPELTGEAAYYRSINWMWVGVDTRGTQDHITQAQCTPTSNTCDLTDTLSELDFAGLPAGDYTLKIHAMDDDRYWRLYEQNFTVEASYMKAAGIEVPDFFLEGTAPVVRGTVRSNHLITWVWAGVEHRDTLATVTETEWDPMAYQYNIGNIAGELDLAGLEPGEYTYRVEGISGEDHYVLYEKDFEVFVPTAERPFADVKMDDFCYESVQWAVDNGVTQGITDITFGPMKECNRAQVVTFLWRVAGCPEPISTTHSFVDVQAGSFYEKAVLWAVENGIINGTDATHFSPNAACNRASVVTILYRAAGSPAVEGGYEPFSDVSADSWYTDPVLWAMEMGITNGLTADQFGPAANCNRAQVVTFLSRAYTG